MVDELKVVVAVAEKGLSGAQFVVLVDMADAFVGTTVVLPLPAVVVAGRVVKYSIQHVDRTRQHCKHRRYS